MPRTPLRQLPWIPLPPNEEAALEESVDKLIATAVELPYARTRSEALKVALFQWTEHGGLAGRKSRPRYRSRAAVEDLDARCQHEHVVTQRWLKWALLARADLAGEILSLAEACLVTAEEHRRLDPSLFGWERYRAASIEVLDAANGFVPVDLDSLVSLQLGKRDHVEANIRAFRREGVPETLPPK